MKTIYTTNEHKGYGKNYYHNEYRQDGDVVSKVRCHRQKFFDGDENSWSTKENVEQTWKVDDSSMPSWIHQYLK